MSAAKNFEAAPGGLTQRLAGAVAALRDGDIPPAAAIVARRGLADWLGVAIAGSAEPVVAHARSALAPLAPGPARLIPGGEVCSAREAALINGIAGHVLDYDDVAMDGHPSAILVPALLAAGTGATGADFIRGYVAGYESWAVVWAACAKPLHELGRHPSSHFGPVAAAAGIAALWRLSAAETANAIGLAAAQAGGLTVNFGRMAKSFQLGRAAEAGLLAARLAQAGVDAAPNVLEDPAGFLAVLGGGGRPDAEFGFGGAEWWILREGLDIKMYPVCFFGHRLVDAALQLHRDFGVPPADILAIELRLGRVPSNVLHSTRPKTVLEAKFSAEFFAAVVLVTGVLGLAQLTPECLALPEVQRLINVTSRTLDDAIGTPPFAPYDQITVHLRDGTSLVSAPVRHAAGSRHAPPSEAEALKKFLDCTGQAMPRAAAENLFAAAWGLADDALLDALLAPENRS